MEEGAAAVAGAVISAAAAVVAVVVAQLATARRERRQRAYAREREALLDVQDAALVVRSALRESGRAIAVATRAVTPSAHLVVDTAGEQEVAQSEADGRLEVRLARVRTDEVVDAVREWQHRARFAFLGDEDVTVRDEQEAWGAMNRAVAAALAEGA